MKITIECTPSEQTQFKQNLKINSDDIGIVYIFDKPEGMTSGEYAASRIEWVITGEGEDNEIKKPEPR